MSAEDWTPSDVAKEVVRVSVLRVTAVVSAASVKKEDARKHYPEAAQSGARVMLRKGINEKKGLRSLLGSPTGQFNSESGCR